MLNQNLKNETKNPGHQCKITTDEIRQFSAFKDTDEKTLEELSEFVFQLSLILYKTNHNEPA